MITLSICMIVKDEEKAIEKCLNSVAEIADEIIIVDTGSKDNTKKLARKYTNKIFDFKWIDDFSAARNFAFSKASMDYILWIDADDILLNEDKEKLLELKKTLSDSVDAVMMKYNTGFDENSNAVFSYYRERLSKRERQFKWQEPVHEYLEIYGNIINYDICITHTKKDHAPSDRNIKIYEKILSENKQLSIRGLYYYARELKDNGRYNEAADMFQKFLDTNKGWVEDNITACGELANCYTELKEYDKALSAMFDSFKYDKPRAEICCQLGYYFKEKRNYELASFWFSIVLQLEKPKNSWGFIRHDCWGYIPCIECAVCYDKLGKYELAEMFNDKAGEFKPDSQEVLYNKNYFNNRKAESKNSNSKV